MKKDNSNQNKDQTAFPFFQNTFKFKRILSNISEFKQVNYFLLPFKSSENQRFPDYLMGIESN